MKLGALKLDKIPYPEFLEFKIDLYNEEVYGCQPVSGNVVLELSSDFPNSVKDVVVECVGFCDIRHIGGELESINLVTLTQRGACPFDQEGMPPGKYEFPFSFVLPETSPASLHYDSIYMGNFFKHVNISYQIRAYMIPNELSCLGRKCLRIHTSFHRFCKVSPTAGVVPKVVKTKTSRLGRGNLSLTACIEKDTFSFGEPVYIKLLLENSSGCSVHGIDLKVSQVVSVSNFKSPFTLRTGKPICYVYSFITKHTPLKLDPRSPSAPQELLLDITPTQSAFTWSCCVHQQNKVDSGKFPLLAPSTLIHSKKGTIHVSYLLEIACKYGSGLKSLLHGRSLICKLPVRLCDGKINNRPNLPYVINSKGYFEGVSITCSDAPHRIALEKDVASRSHLSHSPLFELLPPEPPTYVAVISSPSVYYPPSHAVDSCRFSDQVVPFTGPVY